MTGPACPYGQCTMVNLCKGSHCVREELLKQSDKKKAQEWAADQAAWAADQAVQLNAECEVDIARAHGERDHHGRLPAVRCDKCDNGIEELHRLSWSYCPWCGHNMRGDDENQPGERK